MPRPTLLERPEKASDSRAVRVPQAPEAPSREAEAPVTERTREDIHVRRKAFHVVFGLVIALPYALTGLTSGMAASILGLIGFLFIGADLLRLRFPRFNRKVAKDFGEFMRKHETRSLSGGSFFILGAWAAVLCFPKPVAVASVLCLALADPIASFVGIRWGRIRIPGGCTAEGSLACAVTGSLVCAAVFGAVGGLAIPTVVLLSVAGGLSAAFAEWLPTGQLDDNLRVPVLAGLLLWTVTLTAGIAV